jgi:MFS family permease
MVSAIYGVGSFLSLLASINIAKQIKKFHTYEFTFAIIIAEMVSVILFAYSQNPYLIAAYFIIHFVTQTLMFVTLNIFIESFSVHAKVGSIRGLFLAVLNLGILISPAIGGVILKISTFTILYVVATLLLLPYLYYMHKYLSHIKEPAYHEINLLEAATKALRNQNLRAALIGEFIVQAFYAVMIIYSPIYLTSIGVSLVDYLTIILPLALLPLVILPYELGFLADRKYGEKEMLISGLLVLAVATFACVILQTIDIRVWVLVLLTSRVGAAFVETMSFSYYFKKVDKEDPSLTALFINMQGLATLVVGATGVIVAPFLITRPQLMFIILGCAILWSISPALRMRDTR